jgi:hypothetical protein
MIEFDTVKVFDDTILAFDTVLVVLDTDMVFEKLFCVTIEMLDNKVLCSVIVGETKVALLRIVTLVEWPLIDA